MNENLYLKTLTPSTKAGLWGGGGGGASTLYIYKNIDNYTKHITTIMNKLLCKYKVVMSYN